jgi:hypothetical protein
MMVNQDERKSGQVEDEKKLSLSRMPWFRYHWDSCLVCFGSRWVLRNIQERVVVSLLFDEIRLA